MGIKAAIIDMDGVILDSMKMWSTLASEFIKETGKKPEEGIDKELLMLSLRQSSELLKEKYGYEESADEIMAKINEKVDYFYRYLVMLKKGAMDGVTNLVYNDIKVCVLTATDRTLARAALRRVDIIEAFSFMLTCEELGMAKDNAEIFNFVRDKIDDKEYLGIEDNREVLVIEDSYLAMKTAKEAGYTVCGVFDESQTVSKEDIESVCDFTVDNLVEVLDKIKEMQAV